LERIKYLEFGVYELIMHNNKNNNNYNYNIDDDNGEAVYKVKEEEIFHKIVKFGSDEKFENEMIYNS